MARGKARRPRFNPRRKRRTPRIRRARTARTQGPVARTGWGQTIASGVRSLVSALPGSSILGPIADFALKAFGIGSKVVDGDGNVTGATVTVLGLGGCIFPNYVQILGASRQGVISWNAPSASPASIMDVSTIYTDARLVHVEFTLDCQNPISSRSGQIAMAFTPFRDIKDEQTLKEKMVVPSVPDLARRPGAVVGPASRPLRLRFSPQPHDGYCYFQNPMQASFGMLCVAYYDPNRPSYENFTANDVSLAVRIAGSIALTAPLVGVCYNTYKDRLDDGLSTILARFVDPQSGDNQVIGSTDGVGTGDGKGVTYSGTVEPSGKLTPSAISLDAMSF